MARAFLSYGRGDNLLLVLRLKEDLHRDGWEVWQDKDRIHGGDAFAAEIEDGLRWCDVVVALMGPHSTRRAGDADCKDHRDSICHRELSMADAVKGHGRTVPVMAVHCTPPLEMQGLDYVDMIDCPGDGKKYAAAYARLLDALNDALEGKVRYRAWYHHLRPLRFTETLAEKSRGFHGREWLFREIATWRDAGATQSLLILGDPGVGKSAIAAKLVLDDPRVVAHHFCRHDEVTTLSAGRMVQTLAAHLAASFAAYRARLDDPAVKERLGAAEDDPVNALVQGVFGPLGQIDAPDGVRYLVVDALDEALESAAALNVVRVLASSVERMPRWLRLIATARNEVDVTDRLRALRFHPLDAGRVENRDDVRGYVVSRLAGVAGVTARHVEALCEKSAGNFLYVVQTLNDVDAGHLRLDELERLPPGLGGRYLAFFERHFGPDGAGFAPMRCVLDAMVAAAEPLRESQLAAVTGMDAEEDLPRLGEQFRQYLKPQADWGHDPAYAFYHKSLSDWLTAPDRRGKTFIASARKGHAAIAAWLWREYGRGRARWPAYLVRHLPAHLRACGRWDDLATVLGDWRYLEARTEAGEVAGLAADLAAANAAEAMADHPSRLLLRRVEEAVRRDLSFIEWYPTALFQCLWNSCWWYDCPEAADHYDPPRGGWDADGPPWAKPVLAPWIAAWREAKERAGPFVWVRSLRPPAVPLGGALRAVCTGHSGEIHQVAFSPDGLVLASGSRDNTLRLWDRESGRELACLRGHTREVSALAWAANGRVLASGSFDKTVRLWERETGRELTCLRGHENAVNALAWSADGRTLASGSDDNTVRLWGRESGHQLECLRGHNGPVNALAWAADGRALASGSFDKTVRLWERETGRELASLRAHEGWVSVLAWAADGRTLASGSSDNTLRLWDRESGRELACLRGHTREVSALAWAANGRVLASGSFDKTVRLWERETGRELTCLCGHEGAVTTLAWSADGRALASASYDKTMRLWDCESGRELACLRGHEREVNALAWSADGRSLASASHDKTVRLWDGVSGRELACLRGHKDRVTALVWSADGRTLASGSSDHTVRLWDWESGRQLECLRGHKDRVTALAWSADGRTLASGAGYDMTVRLWDRKSGRELACLRGHEAAVNALAWAADRRVLRSGDHMSVVLHWDADTSRRLSADECERLPGHTFRDPPRPKRIKAFSHDGEVAFLPAASDTPVAWFPQIITPKSADGSADGHVWASGAGSDVLLLRLEGMDAPPPAG